MSTSHSQRQVGQEVVVQYSHSDLFLFLATTNVGPTITPATPASKDSPTPNGEAQVTNSSEEGTETNGSDQDSHDQSESESKNGELEPGPGEEESERQEPVFSAKKVTLPPRSPAGGVAEETETEETEVIPTYDLSTEANITNILESEILENNQNIIERNGDLSQE